MCVFYSGSSQCNGLCINCSCRPQPQLENLICLLQYLLQDGFGRHKEKKVSQKMRTGQRQYTYIQCTCKCVITILLRFLILRGYLIPPFNCFLSICENIKSQMLNFYKSAILFTCVRKIKTISKSARCTFCDFIYFINSSRLIV